MTTMKPTIVALLTALSVNLSALAQDTAPPPKSETTLLFSVTEQVEVEQDILVASLRFEKEAKTSKEVQKTINEKMTSALEHIKKIPSLKVETGQYYVSPQYRYATTQDTSQQILDKWQGSQTLTIQSDAPEDVLQASASLQEMGFAMNHLGYQLSPKKYEEARDGLMEKTLISLTTRAKRIGKTLDKPTVDLVEVTISDSYPNPPPHYALGASAMISKSSDSVPTPSAEAGETTVSLTVNAKAVIRP
jgi:uncharacterized protein YggE